MGQTQVDFTELVVGGVGCRRTMQPNSRRTVGMPHDLDFPKRSGFTNPRAECFGNSFLGCKTGGKMW